MQFHAFTSMLLLGIFSSTAFGITCESGLNHNLGTSCHGKIGNYACSDERGYVLVCTTNGWAVNNNCPSGTGCHNCGCAPGY